MNSVACPVPTAAATDCPPLLPRPARFVFLRVALRGYCFCRDFISPWQPSPLFPIDSRHLLLASSRPAHHGGGRWRRWLDLGLNGPSHPTAAPREPGRGSCTRAGCCRPLWVLEGDLSPYAPLNARGNYPGTGCSHLSCNINMKFHHLGFKKNKLWLDLKHSGEEE